MLISLTFQYSHESNANSGIIASIFNVAVAFTTLIFFCLYKQKLSFYDCLGILLIITSVVLIAAGQKDQGGADDASDTGSIQAGSLTLAIIFAVVTGLSFSLNGLDLYYLTQRVGFPINQLAYDGNLPLVLLFLPVFIFYQQKDEDKGELPFSKTDILCANGAQILVFFACIAYNYGLKYGQAGTIQAISNCKTIVQTVLAIFINHQVPSALQFGGLATGVIGVSVIFVMKKKQK